MAILKGRDDGKCTKQHYTCTCMHTPMCKQTVCNILTHFFIAKHINLWAQCKTTSCFGFYNAPHVKNAVCMLYINLIELNDVISL